MDEQISISSLLSSPPSLAIFYCSKRILQTGVYKEKALLVVLETGRSNIKALPSGERLLAAS